MFERQELQLLKQRVQEPRHFIQIVIGPRQVGKTTLLQQLGEQLEIPVMYLSADGVIGGGSLWIEQAWESARLQKSQKKAPFFLLIIDEVQKIPNWSEMVKKHWDQDTFDKRNLYLILSGSSRLLLERGLTESLAGRFELIHMSHWSYTEMQDAFGWSPETYAVFGGYPGSAEIAHDEDRWKKYIRDSMIETSISKDIMMLTRIDKPALLKNLFELGCQYAGQILSFTKMLGQLQDAGNTTTLSHYLRLLQSAGLLAGLEKYEHTAIRRKASSPKFQPFNNALLHALQANTYDQIRLDLHHWGRIVESAIGAHLLNHSVKSNLSLCYWRERDKEVDFILEKNGKVVAVEVKSGHANQFKGMKFFIDKYAPHKTYRIDKASLPWQEFLTINPDELF